MASSGVSYYVAPIALTEDLVEGATVSGTINGVQISGTVESRRVDLYVIAQTSLYQSSGYSPVATIGYDVDDYKIVLEEQPESDFTIHLTQATPVHKVIIPKEYLDLEIVNGHISYAQMTAETAYEKAETAQSTANTAKSTANNAKTTADTAKTTAEAAKTTAEAAKTTAENAVHREIVGGSNTKYAYYDLGSSETDDSIHSVRANIGWSGGTGLRIVVKDKTYPSVTFTPPAYLNHQADFAFARATSTYPHPNITEIGGIVMYSTTSGSTKKFRITVDDTGTIKATEVTNN